MMDWNWIYQQGIIISVVLTIASVAAYFMRSHIISQSKRTPLPPRMRGALSREEKEQYDKGSKEQQINPNKVTHHKKLTHNDRFDNLQNSFKKINQKLDTSNSENREAK